MRYVVTGPPGSGKTTLVQERASIGALVWDYDAIASTMTRCPMWEHADDLVPYLSAMRDALIFELVRNPREAWIITCNREAGEKIARRLRAELIVMQTSEDECLRRVRARPGVVAGSLEAIRAWFGVGE